LAGLSTREASAEVEQLLRCRRVRVATASASGARRKARRRRTALARTHDHHFGGHTYQLRLFKAVTGQISGPHGSRSNTLQAYGLFYRLPVEYPVPKNSDALIRYAIFYERVTSLELWWVFTKFTICISVLM